MKTLAIIAGMVLSFVAGIALMMLARLVVEDDGQVIVWVRNHD
jgi:hypothetical protein